MNHPELLKSSSNSPPPRPKGSITGVVMVMERKIGNFSLHHHHNTCKKGFFSCEKNPG
jgi:hypothetical protein